MINLAEPLQAVGDGNRAESFDLFRSTLDMDWLRRVRAFTCTGRNRNRKLPAESVVWPVIGMAALG